MELSELVDLVNNRLTYLAAQRALAVTRGDLNMITSIDFDVAKTEATLSILQNAV
jgi:hypothetical protein